MSQSQTTPQTIADMKQPPVSTAKIIMWTILFQFAWSWSSITYIFREGVMPGPDDFMRLNQVRSLLHGQGWFDTIAHNMLPPAGADIHWSRLVDAPIALIVWFFDLFTSQQIAERITSVVWPTILLVITTLIITKVCDSLIRNYNRLLPVFFTVLCVSSLAQFVPGRIDHHNLQILLYASMLWSLVNWHRSKANYLAGFVMALSVSIGLDVMIFIILFMGWFGLEWVGGNDKDGAALMRFALSLIASTFALFFVNIAPTQWLVAHCDANSVVYATAMGLIGGSLFAMGAGSKFLIASTSVKQMGLRLGVAGTLAIASAAILFALYPHCTGGPYSAVGAELNERWLSQVSEAKNLFAVLAEYPDYWLKTVAYCVLMFAVGGWLMTQPIENKGSFAIIFAAFAASVLLSVIQYRTIRIGFFAAIPLCVLATHLIAAHLREKFGATSSLAMAGQALSIFILSTASWALIGGMLFAKPAVASSVEEVAASNKPNGPPRPTCFFESDYDLLSTLPFGHVMADINSAPAIMVFTKNSVVAGPYHRNGEGILDVMDFFLTDADQARKIAQKHKIDYVVLCKNKGVKRIAENYQNTLRARIMTNDTPDWMEPLASESDKVAVYRFKR